MKTTLITSVLFLLIFLDGQAEALEHGEQCNIDSDHCNVMKYLHCGLESRVCECKDKHNTFYDPKDEGMCKLLHNVGCVREGQPCVANGYCPETQNPRCVCNSDFMVNREKQCFLGHDSICNPNDEQCDHTGFLKCTRVDETFSKCLCDRPTDSFYFPATTTCVLTAGSDCLRMNTTMPCLANSDCDPFTAKCTCKNGYGDTPEGRCTLAYGATCDSRIDECNVLGFQECHSVQQKCLCKPDGDAVYYPRERGCRLLEGAGCTTWPGSQRCIMNSDCVPAEGAEPMRCRCTYINSPNQNRECFLSYQTQCDQLEDHCDPAGHLVCSPNSVCHCREENSFFDTGSRQCRYILGSPCRLGMEEQECGLNAVCDNGICSCPAYYEDAGDGSCKRSYQAPCSLIDPCNDANYLNCVSGLCSCVSGFLPSNLGSTKYKVSCLPGYMLPCFNSTDRLPCTPEAQLTCINGLCECGAPSHQEYLPVDGRCATFAGNNCIPIANTTMNVCVDNAFCQIQGQLPGTCVCEFGFRQTLNGKCIQGGAERIGCLSFITAAATFLLFSLSN